MYPHGNVFHELSQITSSLDEAIMKLLAKIQRNNHLTSICVAGIQGQEMLAFSSKPQISDINDHYDNIQVQQMLLNTSLSLLLREKALSRPDLQIMDALQSMRSLIKKDDESRESEHLNLNEFERSVFEGNAYERRAFKRGAFESFPSSISNANHLESDYMISSEQGDQTIASDIDSIFKPIRSKIGKSQDSLQYLATVASDYAQNLPCKCAGSDQADKQIHSMATKKNNRRNTDTFPIKLHCLLIDLSHVYGGTDIAYFLPNGKAFIIRDPHRFEMEVMKYYFPRMNSIASLQRQLNLYDFHRIHHGPFRGAYYHSKFLRDVPSLCLHMKPTKSQEKARSGNI